MQLLLSPDEGGALRKVYQLAFKEARELYVATAYLTHWDATLRLNSGCHHVVFVVGTDFGLTRKAALRDALKWLPKDGSVLFGAVGGTQTGGFHPKVLAWTTKTGARKCLVGSSNLSQAAFGSNYEANLVVSLNSADYGQLRAWIDRVAEESVPIDEDWIAHHYIEAKRPSAKRTGRLAPSVALKLPTGAEYAARVKERRKQQAAFASIANELRRAMRSCSSGRMTNQAFWQKFWSVWSEHPSRFQGSGLQISGKGADWKAACTSLLHVLRAQEAPLPALDSQVSLEIDRLAKAGNPARGAWFSEMLCHYLPDRYPVLNGPVKKWLRANKWRARRGATEGQKYVELAKKLRVALEGQPAGARDLAELDLAIWQWVENRGL